MPRSLSCSEFRCVEFRYQANQGGTMNDQISSECPQSNLLVNFLHGKLSPAQLKQCESHLESCPSCHETLTGLNLEDTLTERIADVLKQEETEGVENDSEQATEDSAEVKNLLNRLMSEDFRRSAMAAVHGVQATQMEMLTDRAVEVLSCLSPDEDSLGVIGDYKLIRLIGAGSMGVVFQAFDQTLERMVALKVLRPSLGQAARDRFLTEAKLAASIEHINVVTIFQVGQVDRLAFMAMQWLPGQTLDSKLASEEPMDNEQIVEIVRQIAAGLTAAHQKQLVHRDIKPANLWICEEDQQLKILDFGLARVNDEASNLTATGMLVGTPGFMSPEQTMGADLDARSDLFSLGCVLYRLLSGNTPFESPNVLATLKSIQSDQPMAPAQPDNDVDSDLSDLAMCLLEKDAADRPQTASQTIQLLTNPRAQWTMDVLSYSGSSKRTAVRSPTAVGTGGRAGRRWATWTATTIGLLIVGAFGLLLSPQIIRIATNQGEIVIESSDDNVEVQVLKNGKVIHVIDAKTQQSFSLDSGQYSLNAVAKQSVGSHNSFSIKPNKLIMKRGETAIVSVTLVAKQEGNQQVAAASSEQPFYQGKSFGEWAKIAKRDRDPNVQADALKACTEIAETAEEHQQTLQGVSALAKTIERESGYEVFNHTFLYPNREDETDLFRHHGVMLKAVGSADSAQIFDFIKSEISSGTRTGRLVCWHYLSRKTLQSREAILNRTKGASQWTRSRYAKIDNIAARFTELSDVIGEHFDKPEVRVIAGYLIPKNLVAPAPTVEQLQKSAVGQQLRAFLKTATANQRFEVHQLALKIFADDQEILQAYQSDLLDPKQNATFAQHYSVSRSWHHVKTALFIHLLRNSILSPKHLEDTNVSDQVRASRVSNAAGLLAGIIDGVLADDEQRLLLTTTWSGGSSRSPSLRAGSSMSNYEITEILLANIKSVGAKQATAKSQQRLLQSLKKLSSSLKESLADTPAKNAERSAKLIKDLDEVITLMQK